MTEEEKESTASLIKAILSKDILAIAAEVYPEEDLQAVFLAEYGLAEIATLIKRAAKQFLTELKGDNWKFLPNTVLDINQRSVTIKSHFAKIFDVLEGKELFDNLLPNLIFIIRYEMHHGFWERSKARVHNPKDLNIAKTQAEVELLAQSLNSNIAETEKTHKELQSSILALKEFTEQKEQEFEALDTTLELASKSLTAVRNSENEASTSNGKIATLFDQTDKALDASRKRIGQDRKLFNEAHALVTTALQSAVDQVSLLTTQREEFDKLVASAQEKEKHIFDQQKRITELLGFAADGALGGEFNKRKDALQKPIIIWGIVSALSVVGALCWIVYVFQGNPSQDKNGVNWLVMLANVVRTSPAFIFVYFCLSQFTKERNLQEEYAFKAAMAMTITAYSDMINTSDERIKMLISTIQGIYTPPTIGKPFSPLSFDTKHLADASKNVADTVKTLQSSITDMIKPTKPEA